MYVPGPDDLRAAFEVTAGATQRTPLLECEALAETADARRLDPTEKRKGVIAYSSGNFAQGLAAAVLEGAVPVAGKSVLIFATGGNVGFEDFSRYPGSGHGG